MYKDRRELTESASAQARPMRYGGGGGDARRRSATARGERRAVHVGEASSDSRESLRWLVGLVSRRQNERATVEEYRYEFVGLTAEASQGLTK